MNNFKVGVRLTRLGVLVSGLSIISWIPNLFLLCLKWLGVFPEPSNERFLMVIGTFMNQRRFAVTATVSGALLISIGIVIFYVANKNKSVKTVAGTSAISLSISSVVLMIIAFAYQSLMMGLPLSFFKHWYFVPGYMTSMLAFIVFLSFMESLASDLSAAHLAKRARLLVWIGAILLSYYTLGVFSIYYEMKMLIIFCGFNVIPLGLFFAIRYWSFCREIISANARSVESMKTSDQ